MRIGSRLAACFGLLAIIAAPSKAVVFDFESEALATGLTSLTMTSGPLTATLKRPGSDFDVAATFGGQPVSWGGKDLYPFGDTGATPFVMNFSAVASMVSIEWGDYAPSDSDGFLLEAFSADDAGGSLLSSAADSQSGSTGFPTFNTVSVASAGIKSIRFIGGSSSFPNSVFYDNITVELAPVQQDVVPEPGTLSLLGLGAVGLLRRRRR